MLIRSERFQYGNKEHNPYIGPGTYIEPDQSPKETKKSKAGFGSTLGRKLLPEDQEYITNDVFEHIEDHTDCFMVKNKEKYDPFFSTTIDRFDKEPDLKAHLIGPKAPPNKNPGPGAYKQRDANGNVFNMLKGKFNSIKKEYRNFSKTSRENLNGNLQSKKSLAHRNITNKTHRQLPKTDLNDCSVDTSKSVYMAFNECFDTKSQRPTDVSMNYLDSTMAETSRNFSCTKGMVKWKKTGLPFKDPEFVPKLDNNMGPGKYETMYNIKPLYKFKQSSFFSSKCKKDTKVKRANDNMNRDKQLKIEGYPGPGSYEYNDEVLLKNRNGTSNRGMYDIQSRAHANTFQDPEISTKVNYCNLTNHDKIELLQKWTTHPRMNVGPATYNVTKDFNKKSFRRNWNNQGFNTITERFDDIKVEPELNLKSAIEALNLNYEQIEDLRNSTDAKFVNQIRENFVPFGSNIKERIQEAKAEKHKTVGPGHYEFPGKYDKIGKPKETLNAFKSKTDRGLLPETKNSSTPFNEFLIGMLDKEKKQLKDKTTMHRSKVNQVPEQKGRTWIGEIGNEQKMKHCLLTTLPTYKQPKYQAQAVGCMHNVHHHNEDDPKVRDIYKRTKSEAPFGANIERFTDEKERAPPLGSHGKATDLEWDKKTYNVTMQNEHEQDV